MLYYIKHEVIGDYVHQIQDGVPIRYCNMFNNRYLISHYTFIHFLSKIFLSIFTTTIIFNCSPFFHQIHFQFIFLLSIINSVLRKQKSFGILNILFHDIERVRASCQLIMRKNAHALEIKMQIIFKPKNYPKKIRFSLLKILK